MITKTVQNKRGKQNKIFISWAGPRSKEIAKAVKWILEEFIFKGTELKCFVSDLDITSGSDWWLKIKGELKTCKIGIICVTKENIKAPWVYFEAGAMIARDIPTTPILINCSLSHLASSPLSGKQAIDFYDQQKFIKMICDINENMKLLKMEPIQIAPLAKDGYEKIKEILKDELKQLKDLRIFNEKYIYPNSVSVVKKNTIFLSAPMSTIDDNEYNELRNYLFKVKEILITMGFTEIICPILDKDNRTAFDGKVKAIKDNFLNLKQVESILVVYPKKLPSSSLVEIGYGIALTKRMVIFYKEGLPYILEDAGENIHNIKSFKYSSFSEISTILSSNGMAIFEDDNDE